MIYSQNDEILIRDLQPADAAIIADEEIRQGWDVSAEKYTDRLKDRDEGKCIAEIRT